MKKKRWFWVITFLVFVLSCISLCACSHEEPGPKTVVYNGKTYMIDEEAGTISDSEHVYRYEVSGGGSSVSYSIKYPNGSSYYWTWSGNAGHGGWSDDYDETLYVDGRTLMNVLETEMPRESDPKNVPMIILLLIVGIFNTVAPQAAWYLSDGWRFKDAEPSETALALTRFGGIVVIVITVFMILAG